MAFVSETSQCRERLKIYCIGYGLDIGYGGDPIVPSAITVDLPKPYTNVGGAPLNLGGDAMNLYWFTNNCLDYVFSSHLLEDFDPKSTRDVLSEWLRVLKPGGHLILYLPDEQKYRKHCAETGQPYNQNHKLENFSLEYVKSLLREISGIEIVHENPFCENYSFEMVIKKIDSTTAFNVDKYRKPGLLKRFWNILKSYFFIQIIDGGIKPSRFHMQNFYEDRIWTNGIGIIKNIDYKLKAKNRYLVLCTKGYHPYQDDLQRLALKLFANNIELKKDHREGNSYYFEINKSVDKLFEIKIESSVFVSKELRINNDIRSLGIDVDKLKIM
jgi:predicted SAM-dependent methyltransferase